jgi:hypothetical protein
MILMDVLSSLINAVLNRNGNSSSESTVVALHCQQMCEWGVRGGNIEFRPIQDDKKNTRLKFISSIWESNQLDSRLDYAMTALTCCGEICWLFLPVPGEEKKYYIDFFVGGGSCQEPEFKAYYKSGGRDIEKVIIIYSYEIEAPFGMPQKKWVRISIDESYIEISESSVRIEFNSTNNYGYGSAGTYGEYFVANPTKYANPFSPYLPIVISKNGARRSGQSGTGDFHAIAQQIETHGMLIASAHKNLKMFASPSLVTTRSAREVLEHGDRYAVPTWAAQNRYIDNYGDAYSGSTNPADAGSWGQSRTPSGFLAGGSTSTSEGNVARIIGGVGEGERFGYIQADPVNGDQNRWISEIRELIHYCLGGVDPLGVHSGATFGEIKTLFGRVQNTADKKAKSLYKYGLCQVFELIIWREEQIYKEWLFRELKEGYPQEFSLNDPSQLSDEDCQEIFGLSTEGVIKFVSRAKGLLPLGDRQVLWRFTKEVFNNGTREQLDLSISGRNWREEGMDQAWVLRQQYPNMSDQEIRNAISGFSPRVVEAASGAIGSLLNMFQQFMAMPDPKNPKVPWGIRLGVPDMLEEALLTLRKELAYGRPEYEEAEPILNLNQIAKSKENDSSNTPDSSNNPLSSTASTVRGDATTFSDSLSAYGLPSNIAEFLGQSNSANSRSSKSSGFLAAPEFPSPGATVSSESIRGGRERFSNSISDGGIRLPATAGNPVDASILPLYAKQLAALYAEAAMAATR